jgi:hypothetical protein
MCLDTSCMGMCNCHNILEGGIDCMPDKWEVIARDRSGNHNHVGCVCVCVCGFRMGASVHRRVSENNL